MEESIPILLQYGYVVLVVGLFVDALGFPFPGDILLLAAGSLVAFGALTLALVIPLAIAAVLIGDSITFGLGMAVCRAEGTFLYRLYCRWTKCTLASRDCFQRSCRVFDSLGKKSVILSKFMWGMREFIPPLAGLSGMRFRSFLSLDALGVFLWVVSFVLAGRFLGSQAEVLLGSIQSFSLNLGLLFAIGYTIVFGTKILKRKRHGKVKPIAAGASASAVIKSE